MRAGVDQRMNCVRPPGNALLLGEMGIANTSVASLLLARLCGLDWPGMHWRGHRLTLPVSSANALPLQQALDVNAAATAPLDALAALGG